MKENHVNVIEKIGLQGRISEALGSLTNILLTAFFSCFIKIV